LFPRVRFSLTPTISAEGPGRLGPLLLGWVARPGTPVAFPGCFPWLPPGFNILTDGAEMFPDRAAICKANRHIHAEKGITRSVAEFFPGQALGMLAGRKVILCGSGPSLGRYRLALENAVPMAWRWWRSMVLFSAYLTPIFSLVLSVALSLSGGPLLIPLKRRHGQAQARIGL
jgi:hypothetical protein